MQVCTHSAFGCHKRVLGVQMAHRYRLTVNCNLLLTLPSADCVSRLQGHGQGQQIPFPYSSHAWWRTGLPLQKAFVTCSIGCRSLVRYAGTRTPPSHTSTSDRESCCVTASGEESNWIDLNTVQGYRRIVFSESLLEEIKSNSCASSVDGDALARTVLEAICRNRFMPTTWLNKVKSY